MKTMFFATAVFGVMAAVGGAQAQGRQPEEHAPSPEVQAFCASHADGCAKLKQLRETAHQACQNEQSTVGQCKQAREAFKAEYTDLESQGLPAPQHGFGNGHHHPGAGQQPG